MAETNVLSGLFGDVLVRPPVKSYIQEIYEQELRGSGDIQSVWTCLASLAVVDVTSVVLGIPEPLMCLLVFSHPVLICFVDLKKLFNLNLLCVKYPVL